VVNSRGGNVLDCIRDRLAAAVAVVAAGCLLGACEQPLAGRGSGPRPVVVDAEIATAQAIARADPGELSRARAMLDAMVVQGNTPGSKLRADVERVAPATWSDLRAMERGEVPPAGEKRIHALVVPAPTERPAQATDPAPRP
jgi:hypothetical protein